MKTLKPFFSYYGSKWRMAGKMPVPLFDTLIEPFAGSAGYSLRHHQKQVKLYDLDPIICALWGYLIRSRSAEILALPDLKSDQSVDDLKICEEAKSLIGFWINKGCSHPCKTWGAWGRNPEHRSKACNFWGPGVRQRIASQQQFIRHWTIEQSSYASIPKVDATWHIDPPYQVKGYHYRCSSKGIDYPHLGQWCKSLPGQVMVCENEGADWLPFLPLGSVKATTGVSKEVLWSASERQTLLFP